METEGRSRFLTSHFFAKARKSRCCFASRNFSVHFNFRFQHFADLCVGKKAELEGEKKVSENKVYFRLIVTISRGKLPHEKAQGLFGDERCKKSDGLFFARLTKLFVPTHLAPSVTISNYFPL